MKQIDAVDVALVLGVVLIAAGFWFVWPPALLFWVGAICLGLATGLLKVKQ